MERIKKKTKFREKLEKRDAEILKRYKALLKEGVMRTTAIDTLCDEFGLCSRPAIYNALNRMGYNYEG